MKRIEEFLRRFKGLKPSKNAVEKESRKVIKEVLNIPDSYYELECKNCVLLISSRNSVLNNEFFLKKEEVQEKIKNRLGKFFSIKIFLK